MQKAPFEWSIQLVTRLHSNADEGHVSALKRRRPAASLISRQALTRWHSGDTRLMSDPLDINETMWNNWKHIFHRREHLGKMLRQQMAMLAVEFEYGIFMIGDPRSLTLPGQGCCGPVSQSGRRGGRMGDLLRRRPSPCGGGSVGWTGPPVRSLFCGFGHRSPGPSRKEERTKERQERDGMLPLHGETSGSRLSHIFLREQCQIGKVAERLRTDHQGMGCEVERRHGWLEKKRLEAAR